MAKRSKEQVEKNVQRLIRSRTTKRGGFRGANGRFISKEATKAIIDRARIVSSRGERIVFSEIAKTEAVQKKIQIGVSPFDVFYWNLLALVHSNPFKRTLYHVTTLNGLTVSTRSKDSAIDALEVENDKLLEVEEVLKNNGFDSPYFQIPAEQHENQKGEIVRFNFDYPNFRSAIGREDPLLVMQELGFI